MTHTATTNGKKGASSQTSKAAPENHRPYDFAGEADKAWKRAENDELSNLANIISEFAHAAAASISASRWEDTTEAQGQRLYATQTALNKALHYVVLLDQIHVSSRPARSTLGLRNYDDEPPF